MTRILSLLFLCLFFAACQGTPTPECQDTTTTTTKADGNTDTSCTISTEPIDGGTTGSTTGGSTTGSTTDGSTTGSTTGGTTGSLPNAAYTFETNLTFFNTDANDDIKLNKAVEIIKQVVATEEFRSKVLNHTYGGVKTFVDNGGFSNAQIYQKILDGAETLQNTKDNEMDMEVELYYASTSTVGYTYANNKRIWVNTKFFDRYTPAGVAHNLFHEWLHKLGFGHASSYSPSRDYSVPYAIGSIVDDIGKDFL
jgi:hypothetical protein